MDALGGPGEQGALCSGQGPQRTVSHEAAEIAANDAVPGRTLSLVKLFSELCQLPI
jgi:hypothetical protein